MCNQVENEKFLWGKFNNWGNIIMKNTDKSTNMANSRQSNYSN